MVVQNRGGKHAGDRRRGQQSPDNTSSQCRVFSFSAISSHLFNLRALMQTDTCFYLYAPEREDRSGRLCAEEGDLLQRELRVEGLVDCQRDKLCRVADHAVHLARGDHRAGCFRVDFAAVLAGKLGGQVAPSMTVGTPTEMTGTPRVRSLSSLRLFCTPEPGEMPVLAIWMVEPRRL